jgi:hypothetical protein
MKKNILFSFFSHFVPLTKRVVSLLFRKKNYPVITVINKTRETKNINSFLSIELELVNVLFLKINENIYPIFHDKAILKITLPLKNSNDEFELKAVGLFKSKLKKVKANSSSQLHVKSILFDRLGNIADMKLLLNHAEINNLKTPFIYDLKAPLDISHSSEPILFQSTEIKEKTYLINYKQNIKVNLDLTELELNLKNQLSYE